MSLFGREPEVIADEILGHGTTAVPITDPEVIATSGIATHLGLVRRVGDSVAGGIITLTTEELAAADAYEVSAYARRRVMTRDGGAAWCYVSAAPLAVAERIALIGDSIAYGRTTPTGGWAAAVAADHILVNEERNRFFNLAWPGARLTEVLDAAAHEVVARRADTICVAAGINDLLHSPSGAVEQVVQGLVERLDLFAGRMEAQGRRVVVLSPNWLDSALIDIDISDVHALRAALQSWCASTHRDFIDSWNVLENRPELLTDGIHPGAEGHALLARAIAA
nr:GDSL-type esterase/lipase family protein [Leucobacter exalbidus]